MRRLKRWTQSWASCVLISLGTGRALGEPNRATLEIVGTLRARVELDSLHGVARIHGRVDDELGRPVHGANIVLPGSRASTCDGTTPSITAEDGTFCVQAERETQVDSVRIEASGFDALELPLRDQATRTGLEITYAPRVVDLELERPESVTVSHPRTDPRDLELVLEGPLGSSVLAHRAPSENAQTDLTFYPNELKDPGTYSFFVRQGPVRSGSRTLLVRAKVQLTLVHAIRDRQSLDVTLAAKTDATPAQNGRIEVTLGPGDVQSAELRAGQAHFEIPRGERDLAASFSYVPLSPEYLAGTPLRVDVPKRESFLPGWWLHGLLLALFLFWFQGRWRRRSNTPLLPEAPIASILAEPDEPALQGVRGTVVDAHTREPQVGAIVTLLSLTASGESSLGQVSSDEAGQFSLPLHPAVTGPLAVRVEQEGYRTVRGPVARGLLRIQIIERRRGALMDLVLWARRAGSGWRETRAPTPLEVAKQSHEEGQNERRMWAEQVNVEAFGADEPSRPPLGPPPHP